MISESPMRERLVGTAIAVVDIRSGGSSFVTKAHVHLARRVDVHGDVGDWRAGVAAVDRSEE
jgi:hypothetical protein